MFFQLTAKIECTISQMKITYNTLKLHFFFSFFFNRVTLSLNLYCLNLKNVPLTWKDEASVLRIDEGSAHSAHSQNSITYCG